MKKIFLGIELFTIFLFADVREVRFATQDFAPFHYVLDNKVVGPMTEVVEAVCHEAKWRCIIESFPKARTELLVKSGEFNGIYATGKNKEREEWADFSFPLIESEYGFFAEKSSSLVFRKIEDIKDLTIGVYGPSGTSASLDKIKSELNNSLTIDMRSDDESGFKKLSIKRIDAVYSNKNVGNALIAKLNLENIKYIGKHKPIVYYVAFGKNDKNKGLVEEFNKAYKKLYESKVIKNILSPHFIEASPIP